VSAIPRSINVVVLGQSQGGAVHFAQEDFSIAFGDPTSVVTINNLLGGRARIERSLVDNAARPTVGELAIYGGEIADTLLKGAVRDLYTSLNDSAIALTISSIDPKLKSVPWEYLVWPDLKLGPHPARSVVRLVPNSARVEYAMRQLRDGKLRVVLIGADVYGHEPIPWDEVKANLERVFGRLLTKSLVQSVQFDLVEGASRTSIMDQLSNKHYDVVHFVGHGRPDGLLLNGGGGGDVLPADAFSRLLATMKPALVILSACETGRVDDVQPLGNIAEQIVAAGIAAVVANQMPITMSAIGVFCTDLYRSLLETGNIDTAVSSGRGALLGNYSKNEAAAVEWGIPILYRRPGCGQLLAVPVGEA
jgi:CHAT domain